MLFLIIFSTLNHLHGDIVNNSIYLIIGLICFILWNNNKESNKRTRKNIKEKINKMYPH